MHRYNDHSLLHQVCVMIHCGSRGLGHQVATGEHMLLMIVVVVEHQLPKTLPILFGASTKRNLQLRVVCDVW